MPFKNKQIENWDKFTQIITKKSQISKMKDKWVYRGQGKDDPLKTSLERAQEYFDIKGSELPGIEEQMIRYYRRGFPEEREDELNKDTLYCISLMQHYGAPTRLLDFTWSPYVGAFFALERSDNPPYEKREDMPVLWCLNSDWIESEVKKMLKHNKLFLGRWYDKKRNDETFVSMYMSKRRRKFVLLENSLRLNTRLVIQQGIFLCPGDISCSFEDNLKNMEGWDNKKNVLKIYFNFSVEEKRSALETLRRMNITQASLFPGLEGYSRSMKQLIPFFESMSEDKAGKGGKYTPR